MSVGLIGAGYFGIGAVLAIAALAMRRASTTGDVVMLFALWPLAVPLLVVGTATTEPPGEAELALAVARLAELDAVLARPDFDMRAAERRAHELAARGASAAAATAQLRVRTLGHLQSLRERYRAELEEVRELIAQLATQAELVRLQPWMAVERGELVRELVSRVEALGELFAEEIALERRAL